MTGGQSYVHGLLLKNLDELRTDLKYAEREIAFNKALIRSEDDIEQRTRTLAQAEINRGYCLEAVNILNNLLTTI